MYFCFHHSSLSCATTQLKLLWMLLLSYRKPFTVLDLCASLLHAVACDGWWVFLWFQAIQNPSDHSLQEKAWNSVCPLVIKLKRFYSFSLKLGAHTAEQTPHFCYWTGYVKVIFLITFKIMNKDCVCVCTEKALQSLLESLTCPPLTPTQHLEREQALAKQFAEILHFTLRFDELKVCGNTRAKLRRTHTVSLTPIPRVLYCTVLSNTDVCVCDC